MPWYELESANDPRLDELAKQYNLHPLHIEDCRSEHEGIKVDTTPKYTFAVFRPVHLNGDPAFTTIDIFAGKDFFITIAEPDCPASAEALARAQVAQYALTDRDQLLAYMPVGSRADHHFSCVLALAAGLTLNFPESTDTAQNDMREIGPSLHVLPDWALAQLMRAVLRRAKEANVVSAYLFDRYMGKPRAVAAAPGPLGRLLFHRPLCDVLGMGRTRLLFVDGRQADPAAVAFFESLGLRLAYLDDWAVTASGGICASGASLPSATSACR